MIADSPSSALSAAPLTVPQRRLISTKWRKLKRAIYCRKSVPYETHVRTTTTVCVTRAASLVGQGGRINQPGAHQACPPARSQ